MEAFRVVTLNGPRQAGKTTLARLVHRRRGGTLVTFDDSDALEAARRDPLGFVTGFPEPLVIDEFQLAGDPLARAIKRVVDDDPRPGRFLLTGSSDFLSIPSLSESLAGRVRIVDLWPLSQGEQEGTVERFIDLLFDDPEALRGPPPSDLDRADCFRRVCRGGFPEVTATASARIRAGWFDSYVRTVTQRDIRELARIRQARELPRLLRLAAARTAQEANTADLARDVGMPAATVRGYLSLLAAVYLLVRLPAWSRNLTAKVKRRPKNYLTDSGLAADLLGLDPAALARPTAPAAGQLLETFVVMELLRQRGWSTTRVDLHHFRDRDGPEVDVVLESRDGRVAALEVKAAVSVSRRDFRWLEMLRDKLGALFVQGAVLHAGPRAYGFGDRLAALPVSTLWRAGPS